MNRLEEKLKIKQLLVDAITLLCRNGMQFESKFCIEALIAITLDERDVILININETIGNPGSCSTENNLESTEKNTTNVTRGVKREVVSCRVQISEDTGRKFGSPPSEYIESNNFVGLHSASCGHREADGGGDSIKYEIVDESNSFSGQNNEDGGQSNFNTEDNNNDDCYFVKSENLDENNDSHGWSALNVDAYGNIDHSNILNSSASYLYQANPQRKPRVREKSGINKSNWRSSTSKIGRPRHSAILQDQVQENGEYMAVGYQLNRWQCSICSTIYSSERVLREHVKAIHFHKMLGHCKDCGESFKWRHQLQKHKRSCPAIFNNQHSME